MAFDFKKEYKEFYMPKKKTGNCNGSEDELSRGQGKRRSER